MLLVKLNDKLMFNGDKNKSHLYLVYKNKNKVKYLRQLTHLYIKDEKRFKQVKRGILEKYNVSGFDTIQGVKVDKYKNLNNLKIHDIKKISNFYKYVKVYKKRK